MLPLKSRSTTKALSNHCHPLPLLAHGIIGLVYDTSFSHPYNASAPSSQFPCLLHTVTRGNEPPIKPNSIDLTANLKIPQDGSSSKPIASFLMTQHPAHLVRRIAAVVMWHATVLAAIPCLAWVLTRGRRVRRRRPVVPALLVAPICWARLWLTIALPVLGLAVLHRRCAGGRAWYLPVLAVRCVLLLLSLVAVLSLVLARRRRKARGVLGRVVGGCVRGLGVVVGLGVVALRRRMVLRGCDWRLVCGGRRRATVASRLAGVAVPEVLVLRRGVNRLVYPWPHVRYVSWACDEQTYRGAGLSPKHVRDRPHHGARKPARAMRRLRGLAAVVVLGLRRLAARGEEARCELPDELAAEAAGCPR